MVVIMMAELYFWQFLMESCKIISEKEEKRGCKIQPKQTLTVFTKKLPLSGIAGMAGRMYFSFLKTIT
jgi:hypothetical protein